MECPLNNRIILKKSSAKSSFSLSSGVDLETDYFLVEVLLAEPSSPLKPGCLVCVPKNRIGDVPFRNQLEYVCYATDALYYISSGERDSFS